MIPAVALLNQVHWIVKPLTVIFTQCQHYPLSILLLVTTTKIIFSRLWTFENQISVTSDISLIFLK